MGGLRHFDVLVEPETVLGRRLVTEFKLDMMPNSSRDMGLLGLECDSQKVASNQQVLDASGADMEQQLLIMRQVIWVLGWQLWRCCTVHVVDAVENPSWAVIKVVVFPTLLECGGGDRL